MTGQQIDRDRLRELAENAMMEPPWEDAGEWQTDGYAEYVVVSCEQDSDGEYDHVAEAANERLGAFIAAADPNTVRALLDMLGQAEATLAAIKARDEEVSTDEGWWIGGAWGDYGEVVVPLRILSYVIDGNLDQKVTETSPDYALTYAEQVARADQAEARIKAARVALSNHPRACEKYPDDYVIRCGWKSVVLDVQAALDGER